METLEDGISWIRATPFEECRSPYPSKTKSGWHSEVSTTPCMSSANTARKAARNRLQVYLLYRSDAWHNRSSMEPIAPFSSLENMMEYLRRKKKEIPPDGK